MFPSLAIKIFLAGVTIFFFVLWYLAMVWTGRKVFAFSNIVAGLAVSLLYSFKLLLAGALLFIIAYFIWFYLL